MNETKDMKRELQMMLLDDEGRISQRQLEQAISIFKGGDGSEDAEDEIISRQEAAEMLKVTPTTITNWANEGLIRRLRINGRKKSVGYSRNSIIDLIHKSMRKSV